MFYKPQKRNIPNSTFIKVIIYIDIDKYFFFLIAAIISNLIFI